MEKVQCVVVGAGVVGLAVARALARAGREVLLLEAQPSFGTQTSSRNSEVIHSGIYDQAGSLKARLCVHGRDLLLDFCRGHGVAHQCCGKWVVATHNDQITALQNLALRARANGLMLRFLERHEIAEAEPALFAVAALEVAQTAIVDSHALMWALLADFEAACGTLVTRTRIERVSRSPSAWVLHSAAGDALACSQWVNAAGHGAVPLARATQGLAAAHIPRAWFAKGCYFTLNGRSPFRRLIYPLPEAAGLGVHLTLDLAGQARFGPDVHWVDGPDDLSVPAELVGDFEVAVRRYWPGLPEHALQPGYAGVRPKISAPGEPSADFLVQCAADHGLPGLVNLFGIESPGLTSALALAEWVRERLPA